MSTPDKSRLLAALPALQGRRILVVGDVFLDEYLIGRATRLSREAPIPVLEFERRFVLPGGAANPARNVVALEGEAVQVGVIGADEAGEQLVQELQRSGIDPQGLVTDPSRPTTTKTRIVAQGSLRFPQQLARLDRLDRRPLDATVEREIIARLEALTPQVDALCVSDYRTGMMTPAVVAACRELAARHGKLLTVDSQGGLHKYSGYYLFKCNHHEAAAMLGRDLRDEEDFQVATTRFLAELGAAMVVITRGAEGMSLQGQETPYLHLPAANRSEVYDVTGAGDTVIAVLTQALAARVDLPTAAWLANYAAGLVVRKLGNAVATPTELAWAIEQW